MNNKEKIITIIKALDNGELTNEIEIIAMHIKSYKQFIDHANELINDLELNIEPLENN